MNVLARRKTLSESEIARRRAAGLNAIASTEMEGLPVSKELREDIHGWSRGEVSMETLVARTKARHASS